MLHLGSRGVRLYKLQPDNRTRLTGTTKITIIIAVGLHNFPFTFIISTAPSMKLKIILPFMPFSPRNIQPLPALPSVVPDFAASTDAAARLHSRALGKVLEGADLVAQQRDLVPQPGDPLVPQARPAALSAKRDSLFHPGRSHGAGPSFCPRIIHAPFESQLESPGNPSSEKKRQKPRNPRIRETQRDKTTPISSDTIRQDAPVTFAPPELRKLG